MVVTASIAVGLALRLIAVRFALNLPTQRRRSEQTPRKSSRRVASSVDVGDERTMLVMVDALIWMSIGEA